MAAKPNQRVAQTKRLIHQSFLELLRQKGIHQISIRELCQRAGINRTTFYNHYGSQYDVLGEMEEGYLDRIAQTIAHADVRDRQSVHSRVALVLQFIQDNLELSAMLLNNNVDAAFAQRLFSLPKIGDMLGKALEEIPDGQTKAATISFVIYGSYQVLLEWINDPQRRAPAQETELILELAGRACGRKE